LNLLWFVIVAYGLTQILVYGKIFNKVRPTTGWFGELFSCTMCTGFWVGVILWYLSSYTELINFDGSLITALLCGFAGSAAGYVPNILFDDNGLKIEKTVHVTKEKE
jgi:uncharacterized membrane protein